jgi:2-polyprenyl-3-methyl-5-hydroxy-6-metoxy-1,4-benzoquinol methylase
MQYSNGYYDYLKDIGELAHYSITVGYCHYLKPVGAILDVGCGEGILQERLNYDKYSRYVGIDISEEAISRASHKRDAKTAFIAADVHTFSPGEQFDIIIFNECLYYFDDPVAVVRKYELFLKEHGLFIASICDHESTRHIWKMLEAVYSLKDEVRVSHRLNLSWTIKVFTPVRDDGL